MKKRRPYGFGGWAPPTPAGVALSAPQTHSRKNGAASTGREREGKGEGKGQKRKDREGRKRGSGGGGTAK